MSDSFVIQADQIEQLEKQMYRIPVVFKRLQERNQRKGVEKLIQNIKWYASRTQGGSITMRVLNFRLRDPRRSLRSPYKRSGEYLKSWYMVQREATSGQVFWTAATDAPQALRLERGYYGTDSIGRRYAQPPKPHIRPGIIATVPFVKKQLLEDIINSAKETAP